MYTDASHEKAFLLIIFCVHALLSSILTDKLMLWYIHNTFSVTAIYILYIIHHHDKMLLQGYVYVCISGIFHSFILKLIWLIVQQAQLCNCFTHCEFKLNIIKWHTHHVTLYHHFLHQTGVWSKNNIRGGKFPTPLVGFN